jgi:hypothetical protein
MGGDDDIAAALPRPPFPAPARREAALSEALRRFDGVEAPAGAGERSAGRPAPWWSRPALPYGGALAAALLVAVIGLPFVWTSVDRVVADGERRPGLEPSRPEPVPAKAAEPEPAAATAEPKAPAAAEQADRRASATAGRTEPDSVPALETDGPVPAPSEESAADVAAAGGDQVVVTGSRIRRPNLESAVPVTVIGSEEIALADRRASRAQRRGDWNACTIDDPGQNLEPCRGSIEGVAVGARKRAAPQLADGLSRAWKGDLEGATAAFDRAAELAPRSSAAYLNRGLAWRRRGDLDRALADLDQAVRLSPESARAYYHRGLVHRQRGDLRRARADEKRAVELDPSYAPLVRTR